MIVSAIDGRLRFVHPALRSESIAGALEARLRGLKSVTFSEVNQTTGSLLVKYNSSNTQQKSIVKIIKEQVKKTRNRHKNKYLTGRGARRAVKFIMAGTITGSMIILSAGSERWHYRIGSAFLSALVLHLYQNRKTFLK